MKKNNNYKMKKEDFIEFLSQATPEEINKYILEKGKPRKLIDPLVYFKKDEVKEEK